MNILKTASLAFVFGSLMVAAAPLPARSAMTGSGTVNSDIRSANNPDPSSIGARSWLEPSAATRQPKASNCKPGRIFSQHDVVGDPESCIMQGGYTVGSHGVAVSPAL